MKEEIPPEFKAKLESLVDELPFNEEIPRRSGNVAFNHPWEIRAFSITTAMHHDGAFDWSEFQGELIRSVQDWESSHDTTTGWSYYDRWMEALERLLEDKGMLSIEELDQRTAEVLSTPADSHHQHAVREPVSIVSSGASNKEGP